MLPHFILYNKGLTRIPMHP